MNRGAVIFIGVIAALLLGIALIDAGAERPIDWSKTYNIRDKIPFGTYIFHEELPNILAGDRDLGRFGDSFYDQVVRLDSLGQYDACIVDVSHYAYLHAEDLDKMLDFVHNGGEIFMSSSDIGYLLLDTLGLSVDYLSYHKFFPSDDVVGYSLVGLEGDIYLEKNESFLVFSELDKNTCTILGHLQVDGYDYPPLPNFISVSHGKGKFYLHLTPLVFTNYNMLKSKHYSYAANAINVIQHKQVYWQDNYAFWDEPRTPLRVILGMKGFSQAWYLLLLGLVLLMLFKSRREQRAVKVVLPEPNLSKDFAKVIGALYYESGQPGNIIKKKIDYFLYDLRNLYQVDTLDLTNSKMIKLLALKSGIDEEEVKELMQLLHRYSQRESFTFEDVKMINNRIEEFKSKANIV